MNSPIQRFGSGFLLGILVALIAAGCSDREPPQATVTETSRSVPPPSARVDGPPQPLLDVGDEAETLFDQARVSNWTGAAVAFQAMNESAADLPSTFSQPDVAARLKIRINEVGDAVSARERLQAMDFANRLTLLVAELSEEYQTEVPYALVLLDYYGRELEIGIAAGDQARLKRATADLQQTWNRFERTILQRGAVDDARRFTDIVVQLEGAQAPADFVEPTRAELDAVDRLEKIFTS